MKRAILSQWEVGVDWVDGGGPMALPAAGLSERVGAAGLGVLLGFGRPFRGGLAEFVTAM